MTFVALGGNVMTVERRGSVKTSTLFLVMTWDIGSHGEPHSEESNPDDEDDKG